MSNAPIDGASSATAGAGAVAFSLCLSSGNGASAGAAGLTAGLRLKRSNIGRKREGAGRSKFRRAGKLEFYLFAFGFKRLCWDRPRARRREWGRMETAANRLHSGSRLYAERRLREVEERYALATSAALEGIYEWNLDAGTLFLTEQAKAFFALAGDD